MPRLSVAVIPTNSAAVIAHGNIEIEFIDGNRDPIIGIHACTMRPPLPPTSD
jgi:hypothetical protein